MKQKEVPVNTLSQGESQWKKPKLKNGTITNWFTIQNVKTQREEKKIKDMDMEICEEEKKITRIEQQQEQYFSKMNNKYQRPQIPQQSETQYKPIMPKIMLATEAFNHPFQTETNKEGDTDEKDKLREKEIDDRNKQKKEAYTKLIKKITKIVNKKQTGRIIWNETLHHTDVYAFADGSVTAMGTKQVSQGAAYLALTKDAVKKRASLTDMDTIIATHCGPIIGDANSTRTEFAAALRLLIDCPMTSNLVTWQDNETVVNAIEDMIASRPQTIDSTKGNQVIKSAILGIIKKREEAKVKTQWKWIKAHANNYYNEAVDKLAKEHDDDYKQNDTPTDFWEGIEDIIATNWMEQTKAIIMINGEVLEESLSKFLARQEQVKITLSYYDTEWIAKYYKAKNPMEELMDEPAYKAEDIQNLPETIRIDWDQKLSNSIKITNKNTSEKISKRRTMQTKTSNGIKPTMSKLAKWYTQMYTDDQCKVCNKAKETNDHIWNCEGTKKVREDIMDEALGKIMEAYANGYQIKSRELSTVTTQTFKKLIQTSPVFQKEEDKGESLSTDTMWTDSKETKTIAEKDPALYKLLYEMAQVTPTHLCTNTLPKALPELMALALNLGMWEKHKERERKGIITKKQLWKRYDEITTSSKEAKWIKKTIAKIIEQIATSAEEEIWKKRCEVTREWEAGHEATTEKAKMALIKEVRKKQMEPQKTLKRGIELSQRKERKKYKGKAAAELETETVGKEETEAKTVSKTKENHWSRATEITLLILKGVGLKNAMFNKKKRRDKMDEATRKELQERKERLEMGRQVTPIVEENTNPNSKGEEEDPWNPKADMPPDITSQVNEKKNKYKGRKWKIEGRDVKEEEWRRGND